MISHFGLISPLFNPAGRGWSRMAVMLALLSTLPLTAATKTWDGSSSGLWTVAANWTSNAAPVNGDALVFPGGTPRLLTTNTAGAAVNFTSIQFSGPGYELHGPALSITNGLTNSGFFSSGNTIHAAVNVRGPQNWLVGVRTALTLASNVNFGGLSVTGFVSGTLVLDATLTGTAASRFYKNSGGRMEINGSGVVGQIFVNDGTLQVDGAMGSGGQITIENGALLTGNGVVSPFTNRGTVSPGGSSPGRLTVRDPASSVVLSTTNSLFDVQINGPTPGVECDQLSVSNQLQIASSRLAVSISGGFVPAPGQSFVIITNAAATAVIGAFDGLPEGATFSVSNTAFRITYVGGNGNDVALQVVGVSGGTRVWDGGGASALWTDAANWDNNIAAIEGDSLVFPSSVPVTERTNQNTFPTNSPFNRIVIDGSHWNLSGNPVRLLGGLVATNRASGPTPAIQFGITLGTNQTWSVVSNILNMNGRLNLDTNTLVTSAGTSGELRLSGGITGTGRIIKRSSGVLVLSGNSTFTGGLRIESGLVRAGATHTVGPPWEIVHPSAQLMISRMVPGVTASAGVVQIPFGSSGSSVAGNFTLGPTVTLDYLDAINTLSVTGTVNLAGATLAGLPSSSGALQFGSTESLLIQNDGTDPVIGTFGGLPEGAFVETTSGGLSNRITYVGGDGNDVALRSVPPTATHITRVWGGNGTNASWATSGNWVGNIRPRAGDDILFPANAQQKQNHVNTESSLIFFLANSLQFDGADYVITNFISGVPFSFNLGVVALTEGIRAAQPFGTNTLAAIVALNADQDWDVASSDAVLRFNGAAMGLGTVRKTGPGLLESTGALFTNGVQFVNANGPSRFEDTGFEFFTVSAGTVEMLRSGAGSLVATGGVTRLAGTVAPSLSVTGAQLHATAGTVGGGTGLTPNATTNLNLGPGSRCVVEFPTSNSVAFLLLGAMNINGAQLNAEVTYPIRAGEVLSVAAPYPAGSLVPFPPIFPLPTNQPPPAVVNGTFNGLPDGTVTNFSGRPFRINYSLSAGQLVLPGVFLTALPLAPQFTNVVRQANGIVVLQGKSEPSANIVVEGSTNLVQWTVLGNTPANVTGQFQFTDPLAPGFRNRFYRASSQ